MNRRNKRSCNFSFCLCFEKKSVAERKFREKCALSNALRSAANIYVTNVSRSVSRTAKIRKLSSKWNSQTFFEMCKEICKLSSKCAGSKINPLQAGNGKNRRLIQAIKYPSLIVLKNSKRTSKCQLFSFTVLEKKTEWRAGAR